FRTDLRLHDSPALKAALDLNPECLWPIFTWDPHYVYRAKGGTNRWQYLLDCQNDLSASLTKLNPKSKLFVLREAPQTLFPRLFRAWGVTHLVFERDTDAYARDRDRTVAECARVAGVEVITRSGRTLWDSDELVRAHGGKPTMSITQLQAAGHKIGPVPQPLDAPQTLPDPGDMALPDPLTIHPDPDRNARWRVLEDRGYTRLAGPRGDFAVETLEELGFEAATTPHRGGETAALKRLDEVMRDVQYAATFRKPQTSPAQFEPQQSTTLLSPALHFGALSPRLFYHRAVEACKEFGEKKASAPPESLTGQLLFRDMYFACQAALGHAMVQTMYNPQVRFVPWHLPGADGAAAGPDKITVQGEYEVDSRQADEWFRRWAAGTTGFPWIDALMRQLRHDGWIHHLGRHSVACFLTRGGCYVHWERGADVFAELLLDHEPACNAGNWQWLSCTAFFAQYYRCYSPVTFGQKWDREGNLVRRWVPELRDLPAKYIYEPWKAPLPDQKKAGVRVVEFPGVDKELEKGTYPKPMFDFAERRRICIASIKKAYEVGLHGNDKAVLDGTYKSLFEGGGEDEEMEGDALGESDDGAEADHAVDNPEEEEDDKKKKSQNGNKRVKGPMDRHFKKLKT
ncbi:Cryptochrome/photolyase FAD-binding domain-containing protein, partial [Cryphonectria parasitica EP155]